MNNYKKQLNSPGASIYLGVDQTGAVRADGTPKPLAAAVLANGRIRPVFLDQLTARCLREMLESSDLSSLRVVVDCVLGLPKDVKPRFREGLRRSLRTSGYGRPPARLFFESFECGEDLPRRQVEIQQRANSVFQTHPFQKNIQTGTFRIWKELASEPEWYCLPYLDGQFSPGLTPIFEGYPSLAWRKLLQVKSRQPEKLGALMKKHFPKIRMEREDQKKIERDPNLADAAVLALAGSVWLERRPFFWPPRSVAKYEGWILGAD